MQNILKITAILILAILQITLMPYFGIHGYWPNLVLLVALILVIADFEMESWLVASAGGLILDLASPLYFGFNTILLVGSVLIMKIVLIKFLTEPNVITASLLVGLGSIIADCLLALVTKNFLWTNILANGLYSAIISVLLYQLIEKWFKKQPTIKLIIQ